MKNINIYIQEKLVIDKEVKVQKHTIDDNNICFQVRIWGYRNEPSAIQEIGFTLVHIDSNDIDIDNHKIKETGISYRNNNFVMYTDKTARNISITKNNYIFVHDSIFDLRIFYLNKKDMTNFINSFPIDLKNKNSIDDSEDDVAKKITKYINDFFDMEYIESNRSIHMHSPSNTESKDFIKNMFNYYDENTK